MSSNIRAEKKQWPSSSSITSLPEDVLVDILARVPICDYPRVSLVSKHFRSLVSSPEIYARRSSLGCTEHCLYVVLCNKNDGVDRLYMLRRKGNGISSRLVRIPGLPVMPRFGSLVAVGSRIYVFCGMTTSSDFVIDCTSHTVQHLPRMPLPLSHTVADVIGGRIYVVGYLGRTDQKSRAMLVFDTETQTWVTTPGMELVDDEYAYESVVVMAGKIYTRGFKKSFVYEPKQSRWETEEVLSSKYWSQKACVVDDVLYFFHYRGKEVRAYDPERKCWRVVKGLDDLFAEMSRVGCCLARTVTVSYAGKLVLFFHKQETIPREICCAEISLERRKGSQIWGEVDQRSDHALIAGNFRIRKSLDVVL